MLCTAPPQPRAVFTLPSAPGRGICLQPMASLARDNKYQTCHRQPPHKVIPGDTLLLSACSHVTEKQQRRQGTRQWSIAAVGDSESQSEFEVNQDKAREALKNLDQQFESISKKRVSSSPKIKAVNLSSNTLRDEIRVREEKPEISESFLVYTAFALLIFTLFYNILFLTVIKPAVDIPQDVVGTTDEQMGGAADTGEFSWPLLFSSQQTVAEPESLVYEL